MKKIILILVCLSALLSCSKSVEKPRLTIGDYARQAAIIKGVVDKIMAEPDPKKMHEIALAVESSRAVDCIPVGDECDLYGKILNKIVEATHNGAPNDAANVAIYKNINELNHALSIGHEKITEMWKIYINNQSNLNEK